MILSTIGYEQAAIEDFVETLLLAGVSTLIDVRQLPVSRRKGFSKKALSEILKKAGIEYIHLAGLGDPKEGRDAAKAGNFGEFQKIFSSHMQTPEFKADLEQVCSMVAVGDVCLMCYERAPGECHRKYIADSVSGTLDAEIRHLGVREGVARDGGKVRAGASAHPC